MPNYGVIDLGSNTIRLCVYEVKDDSKRAYARKDFRTLLNNKVMAGLSAHVSGGVFTEAGVAHALDVLAGHAKRLRYFDCKRTDVFATAVLRNCANSADAVRAIEAGSGFSISLLSAEDEAHLGFVGATAPPDAAPSRKAVQRPKPAPRRTGGNHGYARRQESHRQFARRWKHRG